MVKAKWCAEKWSLIILKMFALNARDAPYVAAIPKIG
jgi:hypothetical protein